MHARGSGGSPAFLLLGEAHVRKRLASDALIPHTAIFAEILVPSRILRERAVAFLVVTRARPILPGIAYPLSRQLRRQCTPRAAKAIELEVLRIALWLPWRIYERAAGQPDV